MITVIGYFFTCVIGASSPSMHFPSRKITMVGPKMFSPVAFVFIHSHQPARCHPRLSLHFGFHSCSVSSKCIQAADFGDKCDHRLGGSSKGNGCCFGACNRVKQHLRRFVHTCPITPSKHSMVSDFGGQEVWKGGEFIT